MPCYVVLLQDAHAPCDTRGNNRGRRDDSDDSDDSDNGTDDDDSDDSDSSSSDSSSDTESSDSSDDDDDGDENADDSIGKEDMIAALALYLDQPVVDDIKKLVSQTRSRRGALLNAYAHDARSPHDDIEYLCSCTGGTHRYACISKAAKSALRAALVHARVDALRVMTRSKLVGHFMGARQSIARLDNVSHMALAASSGRVEMVAYLHDRAMMGRVNHGYLCGCGRDVYEAALKAPRPDALFWMRDNQCDAYVRPGRDEILDAIASGDAGRAYLAMSLSGNDRRDGYGHDKEDRCAILRALSSAAAKGNLPVLRVAIEEGYCNDITPLLAGAASYGRADVVEWLVAVHNGAMEPHMPQPDVGVTFSACQAYTVMSAAAVADHPAIVAWIGRRATCASVAAGAVWSALTNNPSLETVRAVDAVVLEPFPWQRAVPMILRSCSVHVLRFAVKEHGVVIEPSMMCLLPSLPSDDMIDYLCAYFSRQQLQMALDAVCAQRNRTDEPKRNLIDALLVRVPDLCVAVYDACAMADAAVMSAESTRLGRCACDACGMLRPPAPSPFV
ncbi:hypothetical protein pmac_cds_594 [Pandoravirus macleodensis]|uniref:Ankyrin repeat domain containing protein n=1 Tax=Pandoravirus macleodensis TaxID=2107707 RepID=A0A2U7UFT4_9VIRU|nr:hypothetical protein pmac_cds_594 [Pandoravirus macleodensis]AVK77282.1 hypothetical protein pmac_cds_594 [Pandoravirus macleodensis]